MDMKEVKLINCLVDPEDYFKLLDPKAELDNLKEAFMSSYSDFGPLSIRSSCNDGGVINCKGVYSGATSNEVLIKNNFGMIPFIVVLDDKIVAVAGKSAQDVIFNTSKGRIKGVTTYNFIYSGIAAIRKNPREATVDNNTDNNHDYFRTIERFESGAFKDRVEYLSEIELSHLPSNKYRLWIYKKPAYHSEIMFKDGDHSMINRESIRTDNYKFDIDRYAMCQISKAKAPHSGHTPMCTAVGKVVGAYGNRVKYFMLDEESDNWIETSYPEINYKLLGNSGLMEAKIERTISVKSVNESESDKVELKSVYTKEALKATEHKYPQFCSTGHVVNVHITPNTEKGNNRDCFTRLGGNFPNKPKQLEDPRKIIRNIKASKKEQSENGLFISYIFQMALCVKNYNIEYRVKYDMDSLNLKNGTYSDSKPLLDAKLDNNTLVLTIHAHKSEQNSQMEITQIFD